MVGVAIIVVVLVLIGPVAIFVTGAVWAAILGWFSVEDAERRYEGTEYVNQRIW